MEIERVNAMQALDLRMFMLGGIIPGGSIVDVFSIGGMIDQVKEQPNT